MSRSKLVQFYTDLIGKLTGLAIYLFLLYSILDETHASTDAKNILPLLYTLTQYLISSTPIECCFHSPVDIIILVDIICCIISKLELVLNTC